MEEIATQNPAGEKSVQKGPEGLTPREIVARLDNYIIGQNKAKRFVAVALRNRQRRIKLPEEIRDEVAPKNILMIGPTGVGKTEIARRLAKLCGAPFLKVEATKYTEVGYVGRDVESMVRDLMAVGYNMVKAETQETLRAKAEPMVEDALLVGMHHVGTVTADDEAIAFQVLPCNIVYRLVVEFVNMAQSLGQPVQRDVGSNNGIHLTIAVEQRQ